MTPVAAIAVSGMIAATQKVSASAANLANANDAARVGGPAAYDPIAVENAPLPDGGVVATAVTLSPSQTIAYDPTSPLANAQGLVQSPEIDPVSEISNQLAGGQAFAFTLAALKAWDETQKTLLNIVA